MAIEKTTRYKAFKKYQSLDNGTTWVVVEPDEYEYVAWEQNSIDCGYIPPIIQDTTGSTTGDTGTTTGETTGSTTGDTGTTTGETTSGETIVTYTDGTSKSYSLSGTLYGKDIDNGSNAVTVDIGTGITEIGESCFSNWDKMKKVHIPDTVERIDDSSFVATHSLTSITIPSSVTYIGGSVFVSSSVRLFVFEGTKVHWNAIKKNSFWNYASYIKTIQCTDGYVKAPICN